MDSKKDEQQVARFSVGDTYPVGDCGKFEAGINHLTPHATEMEFGGKLVKVTKGEAMWFQRIAALGNTPEQAEALRDEVLAALLRAEALAVTPVESSIDNARAWLGGAFHREFKTYIEQKLAGDFACALVDLFERKDQEIRQLCEQGQYDSDVIDQRNGECGRLHARIAELEAELALSNECLDMTNENYAALKAQQPSGVVLPDERAAFEAFDRSDRCFRLRREGERYVYATTERELVAFRAGAAWQSSLNAASAMQPEPVAEFGRDCIFNLRKQPNGERWPVGTKLYVAAQSARKEKGDE